METLDVRTQLENGELPQPARRGDTHVPM